jgi:Ca2+/Na+ antiporter
MPGPATAIWTWPDALLAAVLAVCLVVTSALLMARFVTHGRRSTAIGPSVAVALVVAMAATLLTHGEVVARTVVTACVVLAAAVAVVTARRRARSAPPERERHEVHNEIAPRDHRC